MNALRILHPTRTQDELTALGEVRGLHFHLLSRQRRGAVARHNFRLGFGHAHLFVAHKVTVAWD